MTSNRTRRRRMRECRQMMGEHGMLRPLSAGIGFGIATPTVATSSGPVAGMRQWLKSSLGVLDASGNPCTNGIAVKTWQDQSSHGNDETQSTVGQQPLFQTNIINSLPAILFNGISQSLSATFTLIQPATFFFVWRSVVVGTGSQHDAIFSGVGAAGSGDSGFYQQSDGSGVAYIYAGGASSVSNGSGTYSTWKLLTATFNGSSSSMRINGVTVGTGTVSTGTFGGLILGANAFGRPSNIYVAEMLVYPSVVSGANLATNETYLLSEYSL